MATFFVIRHKPTGRLLPARMRATHYNFDRPEGTHEPRLFKSKRAAKNCATCWAQGTWTANTHQESDGWEHASYMVQDTPSPSAVPGRSHEDLEVVPATLTLGDS